ncbi:DUF2793 domain-containing protein [Sphingomonas sp.]|uniref:DUF2793 domain-containing protein n=1 Tax=Sphingomonas sp. TaxID=28214 RepID=UPI002BE90A30|nr:DUF2793 domain-containing protein [Sphingomonas sp.]HWK35574.1 DUF2793 domain-containing protein [Sphingomonas sp.]
MSEDTTARWGLALLAPGQIQKEMTHNEALAALDLIVHPMVAAAGVDTPPAAPAQGACWLVGDAPTGAWDGHAGEIAGWTLAGWRFVVPRRGMTIWVEDPGIHARYGDAGWEMGTIIGDSLVLAGEAMLGAPAAAIAAPAGGATTDDEARAAISAILAVLRHHNLILSA